MVEATAPRIEIRPQPGPQEMFLASPADFVLYGGAAGGGKTWALLLEPIRHMENSRFGAVIFRRTYTQIEQEGGLWDKSMELYPLLRARPNLSRLHHTFPSGSRVRFQHLQHAKDVYNYQGGEIALLMFDEITQFGEREVFYLISRNRSMSGVRPYVRATCNPDPDSWIARFISWWIDHDGYPIPQRCGVIRYFARVNDEIVWASTREELLEQHPTLGAMDVMSFTFIRSRLKDNPALTERDPAYKSKLKALPRVDRERLLGDENKGGNWKIREARGEFFKRSWFEPIDGAPKHQRPVRAWDFAATKPSSENPDPDWTVGIKVARTGHGIVVLDLVRTRDTPGKVEELFVGTVRADGQHCEQHIPQDPGEAGKTVMQSRINHPKLRGFTVRARRVTGDKTSRAGPASVMAEQGLIQVVRGPWNEFFFSQLEAFPDPRAHDDVVDALADGVNYAPEAITWTTKGETA